MKKAEDFWGSLEQYVRQVVKRSPLPRHWHHMGMGMVVAVLVISAVSAKNSVVDATSLEAVIEKAAGMGDYTMARKYWNPGMEELEEVVFPEKKVERRIAELKEKLLEYPGNRQIYLGLSQLYRQLGNSELSDDYREKARILDPNP